MITSRLESKYQNMSAGQKNVADFIRSHLHEAVYMNAKELAEKDLVQRIRGRSFCGVFRL
jgi:DNA-binding MurR/RpiR family transcriptional regulator